MSRADLENTFQRLAPNSYELSSPKARRYNCIAWASKDITRKWDCFVFPLPPAYHWPKNAIFGDDLNAFVSVFIVQGYELCPDGLLEDGYEKVVLYVDNFGEWQHAARQLVDGRWTSKMGDAEDITHQSPDDLGGSIYGEARCFMKRKRMIRHDEKTDQKETQAEGRHEKSPTDFGSPDV